MTSLPIATLADAEQAVPWYALRWLVERYHFVLKSGCRVERLQLETAERLDRAVATYAVVAWRLLWLTYEARRHPEASCEAVLPREAVAGVASGGPQDGGGAGMPADPPGGGAADRPAGRLPGPQRRRGARGEDDLARPAAT